MAVIRDPNLLSDPTLLEKVDRVRDLSIGQDVPLPVMVDHGSYTGRHRADCSSGPYNSIRMHAHGCSPPAKSTGYVTLPQLVVVGDQSSGKSSLLESLTGVPFETDQQLCTRHATQITSRRTTGSEYVEVRIIPGPHSTEEHKKRTQGFCIKPESSSVFKAQFSDILKKANEVMGLRADLKTGNGAVFSEDVLKIEIRGPYEDHLTIIDVPGIFRTTTQGTTKEDMAMVRELVKSYIKESRTIILAVLPSNVDIATQEILELAEEYDKKGERTIGVLTKPDLVLEPGAQAAVCDLVQGNKRPLNLGYFLVRNRGSDSNTTTQTQLDQFFETQPWSGLPRDRLGIAALKTNLSPLLLEITRQNFPRLSREINDKIKECNKELDSLGPSRQDEREQRSFLTRIAGAFQDRARAALAADYNADADFDDDELRLITQVANITEVFSADFQKKAHSRPFVPIGVSRSSAPSDDSTTSGDEDNDAEDMGHTLRVLLKDANIDHIMPEEYDELSEIIKPPSPAPLPQGDITEWIKNVYLRSRGLDLGTFNPNFVSVAFAEQSRKWGYMTWAYMKRCIITVHRFIVAALRSIWPENQGRNKLWVAIVGNLVENYKAAMDQAHLLIEVERRKKPYTLNTQFAKALSRARGNRIAELLEPTARKDTTQYGQVQSMVNLADIPKVAQEKGNMEQLQEEIHDILQAYYQLALDRFVDNVFQLAVDYCLLHGPSSPLSVFNQEWVMNLAPEELERIVGEAKSAKTHRLRLQKKITDLTHAIEILKL